MEDVLEIEGKTIDEAIQKACDTLQVPREKLAIEILSEGSSGLLGILGAKTARIRARILTIDIGPEPPLKEETPASAPYDEETALKAKTFVEGMLARIGVDFSVTVEPDGADALIVNIHGDGGGLLIGKGGYTLDALQYLTNKVLNKNGSTGRRIFLDTENYRQKREESLKALAEKLGEKAKRTKKPVTVNPMAAHERRIVHMALQNDEDLVTHSRGEGPFRKIIIVPRKSGKAKA